MILERLSQEHRNIEKLLGILDREFEIVDRGGRPDYEVMRLILSYFEVYTDVYHHPQENLVFDKLKSRDPVAAAKIGDLAREHRKGTNRLRKVAHAIEYALADGEILREKMRAIVGEFIAHERKHMTLENQHFFPAALKALKPEDWDEITHAVTGHSDPLFSDAVEERFDAVRAYIVQLEQEIETERMRSRIQPN